MQTVTSDIKGSLHALNKLHSKRRTRASAGVIQAEKNALRGRFFMAIQAIASRQEDGRFDWQG